MIMVILVFLTFDKCAKAEIINQAEAPRVGEVSNIGIIYIPETTDASISNFGSKYFVFRSHNSSFVISDTCPSVGDFIKLHGKAVRGKDSWRGFVKKSAAQCNAMNESGGLAKIFERRLNFVTRNEWFAVVAGDPGRKNISALSRKGLFHFIKGVPHRPRLFQIDEDLSHGCREEGQGKKKLNYVRQSNIDEPISGIPIAAGWLFLLVFGGVWLAKHGYERDILILSIAGVAAVAVGVVGSLLIFTWLNLPQDAPFSASVLMLQHGFRMSI